MLFSDLPDFVFYLFDQDNEDTLFDIWLHKDHENDFPKFKEKHSKNYRKHNIKQLSEGKEKALLNEAAKYIKPR